MKLTKKTITGFGYYHIFKNIQTGEIVNVKCTQKEYERMGGVGGEKFNPTLAGHIWLNSVGGAPEVDTGRLLNEGEYYQLSGGDKFAVISGKYCLLEPGDLDAQDNFIGTLKG